MGILDEVPKVPAYRVMNLRPVGTARIRQFLVAEETSLPRRLTYDFERLVKLQPFSSSPFELTKRVKIVRRIGHTLFYGGFR